MSNSAEKFSFDSFKKWMSEHGGLSPSRCFEYHEPQDKHIGQVVESRLPTKRLAARLEAVSGEVRELVADFRSDGGTIVEVEDDRFLIEVSSGRFYLPRHCVKRSS